MAVNVNNCKSCVINELINENLKRFYDKPGMLVFGQNKKEKRGSLNGK
jgi:hypothetical protein